MKQIQLTNDKRVTRVDDWNFEWLSERSWFAQNDEVATSVEGYMVYMHRLILGLDRGDPRQGDHIDFDGFNNQEYNLRIATHQQNMWNNQHPIGESGYRGVIKRGGGYQAYIYHDNKRIALGTYASAIEAARVRDKAARDKRGEFAVLNFP